MKEKEPILCQLQGSEKDQIVVIVRGGLVQAVYANEEMDIIVLDYDNISASSDEECVVYEKKIKEVNKMIEDMVMIY